MKLFIIASLLCVDTLTRDKLLGLFTKVSENAFANETTGVLKFGLFVPRDPPNDNLLYSIEEYSSQEAFQSHLTTKPVVDMFSWINSVNIYSRDPIVHQANGTSGIEFIKCATSTKDDPYVVVRQLDYLQGKLPQSWPSWKEIVDESHHEKGSLLSGVYPDTQYPNRLFSVDACTSKEYFESVHSKSKAYLRNEKNSKILVNQTEYSFLKMKGGFLSR